MPWHGVDHRPYFSGVDLLGKCFDHQLGFANAGSDPRCFDDGNTRRLATGLKIP
jgi:hypothetical protein